MCCSANKKAIFKLKKFNVHCHKKGKQSKKGMKTFSYAKDNYKVKDIPI